MITTQPCKLLRAHKQMQKKETNASVTLNRIPKSSVYIYRVLKFFFFPFDHCFKPGQGGGGSGVQGSSLEACKKWQACILIRVALVIMESHACMALYFMPWLRLRYMYSPWNGGFLFLPFANVWLSSLESTLSFSPQQFLHLSI